MEAQDSSKVLDKVRVLNGVQKKKYADLLAYINYNTYLCNIKLKQHDRYIWR